MQLREHAPAEGRAERGLQLLLRRLAHLLQAAEAGEQQLAPPGADAGQLVELAVQGARVAAAPVAGDGEAVRLVADLLQQAEAVVVAPEPQRLGRSEERRV